MNETSATHTSASGSSAPGARSRTLVRSITVTRSSVRSRQSSWPRPTSIAMTCVAPRCNRQSVKPPVDAPTSTPRRPATSTPNASSAPASLRPPRDTYGAGGAVSAIGSSPATWRAGLVAGAPPTSTRPAVTASTARARLGARPRRTSSASRRRRTAAVNPPWPTRPSSSPRAPTSWPPWWSLFLAALHLAFEARDVGLGGDTRASRAGAATSRRISDCSSSERRRLMADDFVDRARDLVAGELALLDEFGRDGACLRAAQFGELHARFEIALPVRMLRHCRESLGQRVRFDADRVGPSRVR